MSKISTSPLLPMLSLKEMPMGFPVLVSVPQNLTTMKEAIKYQIFIFES